MSDPRQTFGPFLLDRTEARLYRDGDPVALRPKSFDLLSHLAAHPGTLLSKDALFEAVWPGVTVGDEALTQAIKDLRKALGDDASDPHYIETVPRRGYRFIGSPKAAGTTQHSNLTQHVISGTLGGAAAGLVGGLVFGAMAGLGKEAALIIIAVMTLITIIVAALGAFGLTLGMALASRITGGGFRFVVAGAALGGFLVGDLFHLAASGSFSVLLGTPHDDFTGGLEGLILGGAIASGATAGGGMEGRWPRPVIGAGLGGASGGLVIALADGNLMASSLAALARRFHGPAADVGMLGPIAAEAGGLTALLTAAGEGLLLGCFLVGAILWRAERRQPIIT